MFTGIIEEIGVIERLERTTTAARLTIAASVIFGDLKLGDSVAVNGVCLTASHIAGICFSADVMPETLNRSALGKLAAGSRVNLERAMPANGRFGGHVVTGHIDGTGEIVSLRRDANAVWVQITCPAPLLRHIVVKGSVAIDGISLTVATVSAAGFAVSIVPHTARATTLLQKRPGDLLNLETDILAKYVERLLARDKAETPSCITYDFLAKHGF